jgi:hypothetical protein
MKSTHSLSRQHYLCLIPPVRFIIISFLSSLLLYLGLFFLPILEVCVQIIARVPCLTLNNPHLNFHRYTILPRKWVCPPNLWIRTTTLINCKNLALGFSFLFSHLKNPLRYSRWKGKILVHCKLNNFQAFLDSILSRQLPLILT